MKVRLCWRQAARLRQRGPVGLHGGRVIADPETEVQALVRRPADTAGPAGERGQHAVAQVGTGRDQLITAAGAHVAGQVNAHFRKSGTSSSSSSSNTTDLRRVPAESAGRPAWPAARRSAGRPWPSWPGSPSGLPGRGGGMPSILAASPPAAPACRWLRRRSRRRCRRTGQARSRRPTRRRRRPAGRAGAGGYRPSRQRYPAAAACRR